MQYLRITITKVTSESRHSRNVKTSYELHYSTLLSLLLRTLLYAHHRAVYPLFLRPRCIFASLEHRDSRTGSIERSRMAYSTKRRLHIEALQSRSSDEGAPRFVRAYLRFSRGFPCSATGLQANSKRPRFALIPQAERL